MRLRPSLPLVAWLLLAACALAQDRAQRLSEQVDAYLAPMVELGLFSGAVLIAENGVVLVERAYGLADHEAGIANSVGTRFKLMSTSKTFTGVAILQLVEADLLALTDPVGEHLPDWPEEWSEVTVHDLLDHTSGIPNLETEWSQVSRQGKPRGLPVWNEFAARSARPLLSEPGSQFRYSNFNTMLAGAVAEAVSGTKYVDLVQARILEPAGLTATGFCDGQRHDGLAVGYFRDPDGGLRPSQQDMSHIQPAGGYWSTVGDLHRYDRALRDDTLLDEAARARLVTPKHGTYACCWFNRPVHGHACVQHSGGANGYVADLLRFPDDDACVVALSNFADAPILRVSNDLAAILFGVERALPVVVSEAELEACAGTYRWPGQEAHTVLRRSGKSLLAFDLFPGIERYAGRLLVPFGNNEFGEAMLDVRLIVEPEGDPARIRRCWEAQELSLYRVEGAGAAWASRTGELRSPSFGGAVRLAAAEGRLWLRFDGAMPDNLEVVPVTETLALALDNFGGGTLLRRVDAELRWSRPDGSVVELRPR